ncbi:unnamed protein product, partial [marine sediment metagenome]
MKHYLAKCITGKILQEAGHDFLSEQEIHRGVVDLFDLETGWVIEFESVVTANTAREKFNQYNNGLITDVQV